MDTEKNKTIAVIQARMQSGRLPGKVLKPFCNGLTLLDYQLACLGDCLPPDRIYIATTTNPEDDAIQEKYAPKVHVYRGSEINVLSRFIDIAKASGAGHIIRMPSDNPFIFAEGIDALLNGHFKSAADYTSFVIEGTPAMLSTTGLFAEVIKAHALLALGDLTEPLEKEHVTLAIYTRLRQRFALHFIDASKAFAHLADPSLRLTVDTTEDFALVDTLIRSFNLSGKTTLSVIENIIDYLHRENLIQKMEQESLKPQNRKVYI